MPEYFPIDILILAFIAVLVAYRLYQKFGSQVELDDSREERADKQKNQNKECSFKDRVLRRSFSQKSLSNKEINSDIYPPPLFTVASDADIIKEEWQDSIRYIQTIDPSFSLSHFLQGTSIAYEIVILAIAKCDMSKLKSLVDQALLDTLCTEFKQRKENHQLLKVELISINDIQIINISLQESIATISVTIESEQSYALYDQDDILIAGDDKNIILLRDIWYLERDLSIKNPNWTLVKITEESE